MVIMTTVSQIGRAIYKRNVNVQVTPARFRLRVSIKKRKLLR
jgi:hypothetical protein